MDNNFVKLRTTFKQLILEHRPDLDDLPDMRSRLVYLNRLAAVQDVYRSVVLDPVYLKKEIESKKHREDGNNLVKAGQFGEALKKYNLAILVAPFLEKDQLSDENNSSEISLCLANRAFVLSKMKMYKHAVQDLNLSLELGYPHKSRFKILQRLGVAYEILNDSIKAMDTYKRVLESLDTAEISQDLKMKVKKEVNLKLESLSMAGKPGLISKLQEPDLELMERNTEYPALSSSVRVEEKEGRGRSAIADRFMLPGVLVARETVSASVLYIPKISVNCWTCLKETLIPYPCSSCPVLFCSTTCSSKEKHNRFECKLLSLGLLRVSETLDCQLATNLQLAFRLITKECAEFHFSLPYDQSTTTAYKAYTRILKLVNHQDMCNTVEHVSSALTLQHWLFVSGYTDSTSSDMILCLCSLYLAIVKANCHGTFQLESTASDYAKLSMVGISIFPDVAATFNHSCDPNTFVVDMGQELLTFTSRIVQEGEELTQVYGSYYGEADRDKRRSKLMEKFNFTCDCDACRLEYPTSSTLLEEGKTFQQTPQERFWKHVSGEDKISLDDEILRLGNEVEHSLEAGNQRWALEVTKERMKIISENLRSPHILLTMGMISLLKYSWSVYGSRSIKYNPRNLPCYF